MSRPYDRYIILWSLQETHILERPAQTLLPGPSLGRLPPLLSSCLSQVSRITAGLCSTWAHSSRTTCWEQGVPGLAARHGAAGGSLETTAPVKARSSLHYFFATLWGCWQTTFLSGGLARRCGSTITPSRRYYRDICIPGGDTRAPYSCWWRGSQEPPNIGES